MRSAKSSDQPGPFGGLNHHPRSTMKAIAFLAVLTGISGLFLHQANSSLHEMTVADCNAGIQRACTYLQK